MSETGEGKEPGFPGEGNDEPQGAGVGGSTTEPTKDQTPEGGPWIVVMISQIALKENGRIIADQINGSPTFKLQTEADQWIKENANEDDIYSSMRKGKMVKAEVVRKLREV